MKHLFFLIYQNAGGHQTFQDGGMLRRALSHRCWLSVRGSQTWPFDQVTDLRSRDHLQNLYLHFPKVFS